MQITINGEPRQLPDGMNVTQLVENLGLNPTQVAIERNREIVPKSAYPEVVLASGDAIEIVRFIGGG